MVCKRIREWRLLADIVDTHVASCLACGSSRHGMVATIIRADDPNLEIPALPQLHMIVHAIPKIVSLRAAIGASTSPALYKARTKHATMYAKMPRICIRMHTMHD